MSGRFGRRDPHLAVKTELLVRYLDAWTPVALRSHRGASFVEAGTSAADALRVFGESADLLDETHLDVVLVGVTVDVPPTGLSIRSADPADLVVTGPALAHVDVVDGPLTEADAWRLVASLGRGKGREVLLTLPDASQAADACGRLRELGLTCTVAVELVADDDRTQLVLFATADSKHLTTFKNELWAVDEFAGIRYRDPHDTEHSVVDISLTPQLLPLRRELLAELALRGTCTVANLQQYTLLSTIYRPADTVGALTSAASAGAVTREPAKGRLTPRTIIGHRTR